MSGAETQVQADLQRLLPLLDKVLTRPFQGGEARRLAEAVCYSLEAGGKRVRPVLCLLAAEAVGGSAAQALPGALALEYIHTYSLIHDDLPAMDDDDLRRGRPTNHKVFGEGHAILAGDALLTEAFGVLAAADLDPVRRAEALALLAEGAGWRGMAGGQALDLEGEKIASYDLDHLRLIHRLKTGALLRCSLEIGAVLGVPRGRNVRPCGPMVKPSAWPSRSRTTSWTPPPRRPPWANGPERMRAGVRSPTPLSSAWRAPAQPSPRQPRPPYVS